MVNIKIDSGGIDRKTVQTTLAFFKKWDDVFKIFPEKESTPPHIKQLVEEREKMREEKNWAEADRLRQLSADQGWIIDDTSGGPTVKPML